MELPPVKFKFEKLTITPPVAEADKEVVISVEITNLTDMKEAYMAILWIDDLVEESKEVILGPKEKTVVSFKVVKYEVKDYKVRIDRLFGSFSVVKPVIPTYKKMTYKEWVEAVKVSR